MLLAGFTTDFAVILCFGMFCTSLIRIMGWRCTLGCMPKPMALLMAFAIFLWFTGRRPVSLECLIRPIAVINSEMMEKFCALGQPFPVSHFDRESTYLVLV